MTNSNSNTVAAIIAGLMVPLLAMAIVVGSSAVLVPIIVLALVALFLAGRALGRQSLRPPGE